MLYIQRLINTVRKKIHQFQKELELLIIGKFRPIIFYILLIFWNKNARHYLFEVAWIIFSLCVMYVYRQAKKKLD